MKLKKNGEPDLRANNGGHKNTKKKFDPKSKKNFIAVALTEKEFEEGNWESKVCDQVKNKMNKKIK